MEILSFKRLSVILSAGLLLTLGSSCQGGHAVPEQQIGPSEKLSDTQGQVVFTGLISQGDIQVKLTDLDGAPMAGIEVTAAVAGKYLLIHGADEAGLYMPFVKYYEISRIPSAAPRDGSAHKQASFAPALIAEIILLAWTVYGTYTAVSSLIQNPPVIEEGDPGWLCVSLSPQNIADLLSIGSTVLGIRWSKYLTTALRQMYFELTSEGANEITQAMVELMDPDTKYRVWLPIDLRDADGRYPWALVEIDDAIGYDPLSDFGDTDITFDISPNGTYKGYFADLSVTNESDNDIVFNVTPGTTFANSDLTHQDMTVTGTTMLRVAARSTSHITMQASQAQLYGACVNLHKDPPEPGDTFSAVVETRSDLNAICQILDRYIADLGESSFAQKAIWVITDDATVSEAVIGQVRTVFRAAGLDPDDYPSLDDSASQASRADAVAGRIQLKQ